MALHEPIRSTLFTKFEDLLGTEGAVALMDQFPPYDHRDVVTVAELDRRLDQTERTLRAEMAIRFDKVDERFDKVDERFRHIDERFRHIDERFKHVDEQFTYVNERLSGVEVQLAPFAAHFEIIEYQLKGMPWEIARLFLAWGIPIVLTIIGLVIAGYAVVK